MKKLNYKIKIYLYFMIAIIIPILFLGSYSYHTYVKTISNEIDSYIEVFLKQLTQRMDTTITNIEKYYIEASAQEEIQWIARKETSYSDYSRLVKVQSILKGPDYLSDYISGYTLINKDTDWVISNRGMFPYKDTQNTIELEDTLAVKSEWINNLSIKSDKLTKRETVNIDGMIFHYTFPKSQVHNDVQLIVNVDLNGVYDLMKVENNNCMISIYDQNGQLIYGSSQKLSSAISNLSNELKANKKINLSLDDGSNYRVMAKDSSIAGWRYVVAWDYNAAETGAGNIFWMSIILLISGIALILVVWSLTNVVYKPVKKLSDYANVAIESSGINVDSESDVDLKNADAYKCISGQIHYLVDHSVALQEKLEIQKAQLSEFFLSRLINGSLREDQIENYISRLGINIKEYFIVLTISLQNFVTEEFDEAKQDALRLKVAENMPEEVKKYFIMEPSCNVKVITLVLSDDDKKTLERRVVEVYKGIDIYVQQEYKFSIKMGVSTYYSDLKKFRLAHNEAIEALKNNEYLHQRNESTNFEGVMFYSDVAIGKKESYYYDRLIERELKDAVDKGDQEKAFTVVDNFVDQLINQNLGNIERQFFMQNFLGAILLVAIEAGLGIDEIFEGNEQNLYIMITRIYDSSKLKSFYKYKIITPIIEGLTKSRTSKSSVIIEDIIRLIEEKEGDITLAECADHLNYHSTYIWKVMKVEKNITFSEYVASYKMNLAKEMLIDTEVTIKEIASKFNYTNAQNFIRFFSKIEGITPGKYRKLHRCE